MINKITRFFLVLVSILLFTNANAQTNGGITNPFSNPFGTTTVTPTAPATNTITDVKGGDKKNTKQSKDALKDKTPEEVEVIKDDLLNADVEENNDKEGDKTEKGKNIEKNNNSKVGMIAANPSNIYGIDFFNNTNLSYNDNTSGVPPESYRLGTGDELIINIWGNSEKEINCVVGKDGCIFPKYVGKINVQGMSFENAKQIIINRFNKVIAAGSNMDVQLGKSRTVKVTILGEVKRSGTYSLSSFNTAFNAIAMAEGVTELANIRDIQIRRNGRIVTNIDLYEYLLRGGNINDAYLEDGDIINVGIYEKKIKAVGSFKRPMFYLLKNDEDLSDLIKLAGGPSFDARFSNIQVQTIMNEVPKLISINLNELDQKNNTLILKDGDIVNIKKINSNLLNTIKISGAVNYPDMYQIEKGERLLDIITKAGGLVNDAFTSTVFIYRANNLLNLESIKLSLDSITKNPEANLMVYAGDEINIISKQLFVNKYNVEVIGEVRRPGSLPALANLTIKDILIQCGGLNPEAENGRIEIARIVQDANNYDIKVNKDGNPTIETILINPNLEIDEASKNIILHPFDKVYVRRKSEYKLMETVSINGEVNYPGQYPVLFPNEPISSILKRAGGLKIGAFVEGTSLTRGSVGNVVINLKEALNNPNCKANLIVKNGDAISIPKINEIIIIKGQVQTPINIIAESESKSVRYYIDAAGGFGEKPWKDRISVRYPNGKLKSTKRIFFIRKYPTVTKGCLVYIPRKPDRKELDFSWRDTQGFAASLINTITAVTSTVVLLKTVK
jgi:protein involved in polysaccharide export with SLBB domain